MAVGWRLAWLDQQDVQMGKLFVARLGFIKIANTWRNRDRRAKSITYNLSVDMLSSPIM